MRILLLSAFYPPHVIGGWDILVENLNQQLRARGHITHVLTSRHGVVKGKEEQDDVSRKLILENGLCYYNPMDFFLKRHNIHQVNLRIFDETIAAFRPDVCFVHGMYLLWKGVPWYAEQRMPGKVVYYIADDWPYARSIDESYWRLPANHPILALAKRWAGNLVVQSLDQEKEKYRPRFEHVLCVSRAVRQALIDHLHLPSDSLQVVYNGIELDQFVGQTAKQDGRTGLSLLYAGNITVEKGVHTAVEALHLLAQKPCGHGLRLTIVGSGHPEYEANLRMMVEQYHLGNKVQFVGRVPRQEMPHLLSQHDVLVFPSNGEALPRIVEEAMASGLVVIGTTAGGTGEILIEGETGLTFEPGDAAGLARQIERLIQDDVLYHCLQQHGQDLILRQFDMQKTVSAIESYLQQVAGLPEA